MPLCELRLGRKYNHNRPDGTVYPMKPGDRLQIPQATYEANRDTWLLVDAVTVPPKAVAREEAAKAAAGQPPAQPVAETATVAEVADEPPPKALQLDSILEGNIGQIAGAAEEIDDPEVLRSLGALEAGGANRKGALKAIAARLEALEE